MLISVKFINEETFFEHFGREKLMLNLNISFD